MAFEVDMLAEGGESQGGGVDSAGSQPIEFVARGKCCPQHQGLPAATSKRRQSRSIRGFVASGCDQGISSWGRSAKAI
jgi:hypothetical protein